MILVAFAGLRTSLPSDLSFFGLPELLFGLPELFMGSSWCLFFFILA
jgi:hypothetical protein